MNLQAALNLFKTCNICEPSRPASGRNLREARENLTTSRIFESPFVDPILLLLGERAVSQSLHDLGRRGLRELCARSEELLLGWLGLGLMVSYLIGWKL